MALLSPVIPLIALWLPLAACAPDDDPDLLPIPEAASGDETAPSWYRPPATAERWAPELHSPDGWTFTPTVTPDFRRVYYARWDAPDFNDPSSIQELWTAEWDEASGAWTAERVEATAGWRVDWPHVAPDGERFFLSYIKPHPGQYNYPDGLDAPRGVQVGDFDLWSGAMTADGRVDWDTFLPIDGPDINRQKTPENALVRYVHNETAPRTTLDGDLYFWTERLDDGGGRRDVYRAAADGTGGYQPPELLPFNTSRRESGVSVDPEGRWVIFASEGLGGEGQSDLFVVVRDGDGWGEPVNLGPAVNSPFSDDSPEVSPDGQTLFFSTARPGPDAPYVDAGEGGGPAIGPHWVDLTAVEPFRRATGLVADG
ncbi:MAG: hypothetical protein AAGK21_01760 [Bacteroidota bacterium]